MKGKYFAIILLINFALSLTLNAQWARIYGGSEDDRTYSFQQTIDGGYIVLGSSESFGANIWILKLNILGDIEWQKTFGGHFNVYTYDTYSIQKTNDGGYIFGGSLSVSGLNLQLWITKLSADGNIIWQKSYGDNDINYFYSLKQTSDGGYIVGGSTGSHDVQGYDFLILKLFFDGTIEWSKTYGGSMDDRPSSILLTSDGGYIVAGYTMTYGEGSSDIWISKLASDGNIEWQKTFGGSQADQAFSIKQTTDGGFIVAGSLLSYGASQPDSLVLKLSSEGGIEWQKIYGGSEFEAAYSIQQTVDGGYVVAGETKSFGAGNGDVWILKLTSDGNIEWQKTYGGLQDEEAKSIQQTNDGGYFVAGSTESFGSGEQDIFILKLFQNGDINSSCGFVKESNSEVSDPGIIPANTYIDSVDIALFSEETNITPMESEAVVYSLCSEGQHTLSLTASSGGTTDPQPGTYIYDHAERITVSPQTDSGYNFIGWSGDVLSADKFLSVTMDSDKSVKANFSENVVDEIWEEVKKAPCFIATAAFGSPFHPFVITLQDFRDKYLMSSRAGRKLVNLYYKYSPHIAELITNHKVMRTVVRIWLMPVVALGYSMVHFGPVKTSLMLILTNIPLFFFVWFYRRRGKRGKP